MSDGGSQSALFDGRLGLYLPEGVQLPKLMIDRMAGNDDIVKRCLNDPDFQEIVFAALAKGIYETVTAQ